MRILAGFLSVLGGCYAPSPPSGVPCDPAASHCPVGQICTNAGGGHVCASSGVDDAGGLDGPDAPIDALIDAPIDAAPIQVAYQAAIAECLDPAAPDPATCRSLNGNAQLAVDLLDSSSGSAWAAFVRFDLDGALQGRTITRITLRAVVSDAVNAEGPDTGTVFLVQPFTLASLTLTTPAKLGDALAGSVGAVAALEVVDWTLPPSIATANGPLHLGVFPNDENGVTYWNLDGPNPPRLIIDAQ